VWHAGTTTPRDRQRVARLLLERVTVIVDKESERVDVSLCWVGGQVTEHRISRPVSTYERQSDYPRLVARLREMCESRLSSSEMAEELNAEGFRPPKRVEHFEGGMVLRLTNQL